jgi:hypothetical protein
LNASSDDEEEGFHHARLDRATELYEQFGQVWADYLEQQPHRLTMDTDPDGFTRIRVVSAIMKFPSLRADRVK